ncbi:hypothetical protein ACFVFS_16915 [Kitasatospora sp. NPDC057692]|uniref:hypothetical protein n=1 Tax=Kitasatospora sp. NPDC057692 TaxID=3346215 RepID=UPI0036C25885
MAGGKLWGYVASGARALGGLGPLGRSGASAGARLVKGVGGGGRQEPGGRAGVLGGGAGAAGARRQGRAGAGGMAGPQPLSRPELERLRWTDRAGGCVPDARHVQPAELVARVLRGGGRASAVTVRVPVGLPVVVADSVRLEAALAALVDHAIRRSPSGARVLVRADPLPGPDGRFGGRGGGRFGGRGGGRFGGRGGAGGWDGAGGADLADVFGGPEPWAVEPARVELRVVDRGASEQPEARQWLLGGVAGAAVSGAGTGDAGTGGSEGGSGGGGGGRVGPSLSGLVRAAGGRLSVEQTPGGGLTVVVALTVARD